MPPLIKTKKKNYLKIQWSSAKPGKYSIYHNCFNKSCQKTTYLARWSGSYITVLYKKVIGDTYMPIKFQSYTSWYTDSLSSRSQG